MELVWIRTVLFTDMRIERIKWCSCQDEKIYNMKVEVVVLNLIWKLWADSIYEVWFKILQSIFIHCLFWNDIIKFRDRSKMMSYQCIIFWTSKHSKMKFSQLGARFFPLSHRSYTSWSVMGIIQNCIVIFQIYCLVTRLHRPCSHANRFVYIWLDTLDSILLRYHTSSAARNFSYGRFQIFCMEKFRGIIKFFHKNPAKFNNIPVKVDPLATPLCYDHP